MVVAAEVVAIVTIISEVPQAMLEAQAQEVAVLEMG
tara:strand:+ start:372 stop:479 length:108 start_codon:yes stop_codon:yes gene_type:complete